LAAPSSALGSHLEDCFSPLAEFSALPAHIGAYYVKAGTAVTRDLERDRQHSLRVGRDAKLFDPG
jgi:hypothetical protein